LLPESAEQRHHPLREVFNGLRYLMRYGVARRALPNDLPPWDAVYEQAKRWLTAGCFEMLAQDLLAVLRLTAGRKEDPTAAVLDRLNVVHRSIRFPVQSRRNYRPTNVLCGMAKFNPDGSHPVACDQSLLITVNRC
jgi:transposase